MTLEQILKLGEMGFSKDEILKMKGISDDVNQDPEPEPQPEPQPEPESQPQPQNESLSMGINALLEDMHKTLKGMQEANINASNMPEVVKKAPEDILAEVIFPTFNKKKEG